MTQIFIFIASSLLLCVVLSQRPSGLALAGHFFSRATPPGGGQRRRPKKSRSRTATAAGPSTPSQSGLSAYPDLPLGETPRAPVTPRFVVEHRTALGGKELTVRGRVVLVANVPAGGARPRIFVAETCEPERDKNYDLMVLLSEDDGAYALGQEVELKGTVESSKVAVYLRKSYD